MERRDKQEDLLSVFVLTLEETEAEVVPSVLGSISGKGVVEGLYHYVHNMNV